MSRHSISPLQRRKCMMYLYSGFLSLWALAIVLMPIGSVIKENSIIMLYFSGAAFWIGLAGTICMAFKINNCRKASYRFKEHGGSRKQLGAIHFFQNKEAIVMDTLMFVSIIGLIIAKISTSGLLVSFLFFAVFVFSFGMHCMLNGINYRYIKYKVGREEDL